MPPPLQSSAHHSSNARKAQSLSALGFTSLPMDCVKHTLSFVTSFLEFRVSDMLKSASAREAKAPQKSLALNARSKTTTTASLSRVGASSPLSKAPAKKMDKIAASRPAAASTSNDQLNAQNLRKYIMNQFYCKRSGESEVRLFMSENCRFLDFDRSLALHRAALKYIMNIRGLQKLDLRIITTGVGGVDMEDGPILPPLPSWNDDAPSAPPTVSWLRVSNKAQRKTRLGQKAAESLRNWASSIQNLTIHNFEIVSFAWLLMNDARQWNELNVNWCDMYFSSAEDCQATMNVPHLTILSNFIWCPYAQGKQQFDAVRSLFVSAQVAYSWLFNSASADEWVRDGGKFPRLQQLEIRPHSETASFAVFDDNRVLKAMSAGCFPLLRVLKLLVDLRSTRSEEVAEALKAQAAVHPLDTVEITFEESLRAMSRSFGSQIVAEALAMHPLKRLALRWDHSRQDLTERFSGLVDACTKLLSSHLEELDVSSMVCSLRLLEKLVQQLATTSCKTKKLRFLSVRCILELDLSDVKWAKAVAAAFKPLGRTNQNVTTLSVRLILVTFVRRELTQQACKVLPPWIKVVPNKMFVRINELLWRLNL